MCAASFYVVKSDGTITDANGVPLKLYKERNGYMRVWIIQNGKRVKASVHRLVAKAFIPNPENKPCVNHIDGNKENNCASNLEWCTHSENEKHSYRVLGKKLTADHHKRLVDGHTKAVSKSVVQMTKDGSVVNTFPSLAEAYRQTGISEGNISECCNNRRNTAGGYKWNFVI